MVVHLEAVLVVDHDFLHGEERVDDHLVRVGVRVRVRARARARVRARVRARARGWARVRTRPAAPYQPARHQARGSRARSPVSSKPPP